MTERPILFSAPMVRAILAGTKTQTRRIAKPQPEPGEIGSFGRGIPFIRGRDKTYRCPYGQPGDRLWVREAFDFLPSGGPDQPTACEIVYWANGAIEPRIAPPDYNPMVYAHEKIRPSIHMPRWASRITLEITGVRVERLQDISKDDAKAEGVDALPMETRRATAKADFHALWESINGAGSWDANPWVWVLEFRRLP